MLNNALNKTLSNEFSYQMYNNNNNNNNNLNATNVRPPVQIQIFNGGQQSGIGGVQANFRPMATSMTGGGGGNSGPITFAIVPDLNALRPYFIQVTETPPSSGHVTDATLTCFTTSTATNGNCVKTQKLQNILPKKRSNVKYPLKSASPALLPKPAAPTAATFSVASVRTPPLSTGFATCAAAQPQQVTATSVNSVIQPTSPMTIQLTVEDQEQISILTDELKRIMASSTISPVEREKMVECLQQKRSAILEKTFLQQQRCSLYDQRFSVPNGHTVRTQFSTVNNESFSISSSPSTLPAQIVQINGMPYLALTASSQQTPAQLRHQPPPPGVVPQVNGSQDFQRVHTQSTFGLQLPVRPHLISCQSERNAGQSSCFLPSLVNSNFATNVNYFQSGVKSLVPENRDVFVQNVNRPNISQIVENVHSRLSDDHYRVTVPDCKTAFKDNGDIRSRLLPYHLYNEPDISQGFLDHFDSTFTQEMEALLQKKSDLFRRFQAILLKQSRQLYPVAEDCLIDELISKREKNLLEKDRKFACRSPDRFVRMLIKRKENGLQYKTTEVKKMPENDDEQCHQEQLKTDEDNESSFNLLTERCRAIKDMFKAKAMLDKIDSSQNVTISSSSSSKGSCYPSAKPVDNDRERSVKPVDNDRERSVKPVDNDRERSVKPVDNDRERSNVSANPPQDFTCTVFQAEPPIPCSYEVYEKRVVIVESPKISNQEQNRNSAINEELKSCNEIPRLLLKINQKATKRKRAEAVETIKEETNLHKKEEESVRKVPPLKIKLSKPPSQLQPLTRLSSIGLESSDDDVDNPDDDPTPVSDIGNAKNPKLQCCYVELCKKPPYLKVEDFHVFESEQSCSSSEDGSTITSSSSITPKFNFQPDSITVTNNERPPWDHSTAQFIRSKLRIKDYLSPTKTNQKFQS